MNSTTVDIFPRGASEPPGLALAREMRRRWHAGAPLATEDFLTRHPELCDRPEVAVDLIYEEFCLRQSAGQAGVEQDILRRFPQWAEPLRVMLECHRRLLEAEHERPDLPRVGERVGEFKLLAELGRGSRGRVFLANQSGLGDRPVVLKVTPLDGSGEHLSLARLQHTNIVPLYSVVDDSVRKIRALCMPYFGRATLAKVLEAIANTPVAQRTGRDVLAAIDRVQHDDAREPPHVAGTARELLENVSYVQAMCWLTACLADALQFAHDRGLVYLDLKPSNILLASEGQPMLLDFHLAREPLRAGGSRPDGFGGTPGYMPPEQREAMRCLQEGRAVQVEVDGRADVHSLGAVLYETLSGALPPSSDLPPPPLDRINPRVSAGLSDIVGKCLARRPTERYGSAGALAEDLRRHVTDQPLAGVANRSIAERWRKWRRRRPGALRATAALAVATVVIVVSWAAIRDRVAQAKLALGDGDRQSSAGHFAEATQSFQRGLDLTARVPFASDLRRQLDAGLASARRLELARQLHVLADDVRVLYGADSVSPDLLRPVAEQCDAVWQKRSAIMGSLAPARDSGLADDLQDIALFAADLHAGDTDKALRILTEAESMFGTSAVLDYQRQRIPRPGAKAATQAPPPRTAWEHMTMGRARLAAGELPAASQELSTALALAPAGRWENFYSGVCAYRMKRYDQAVAAFSVCLGTAPDSAACFYNRALAYAASGHSEEARRDVERALQLDPAHEQAKRLRQTTKLNTENTEKMNR